MMRRKVGFVSGWEIVVVVVVVLLLQRTIPPPPTSCWGPTNDDLTNDCAAVVVVVAATAIGGGGAGGGAAGGPPQSSQSSLPYSVADSYPIEFNTDYDPLMIDPYSSYGAPYGGYSRASRERLARLPLLLPETSLSYEDYHTNNDENDDDDNDDDDEYYYFRIRDHGGQLFVCRLYHEDALETQSYLDSMFDAPVLRKATNDKTQTLDDRLDDDNPTTTSRSDTTITTTTTATTTTMTRTENDIAVPTTTPKVTAVAPTTTTTTTTTSSATTTTAAMAAVADQNKKTIAAASLPSTTRVIRRRRSLQETIKDDDMIMIRRGGSRSSSSTATGSSATQTSPGTVAPPPFQPDGTTTTSASSASATGVQSSSSPSSRSLVQQMGDNAADARTTTTSTTTTTPAGDAEDDDDITTIDPIDVEIALRELHGVCGQVHKGYWSYEWCYEKEVTQFHVEYDTKTNQVKVDQVTNLGTFQQRDMYLDFGNEDDDNDSIINEWAEDEPEVARIVDAHLDGTWCGGSKDDTNHETPPSVGRHRRTYAQLQCCSAKVVQRHKGMVHREGRPFVTDLVAVLDVVEDPDVTCQYNITICTPLLCGTSAAGDADKDDDDDTSQQQQLVAAQKAAVDASRLLEDLNGYNKINNEESIRQILDRTLTKLCLQSQSGGWWTYEMCHQKSVRQFHETIGLRKNNAGVKVTSKVVESEHVLGKYDPASEAHVNDEEEYKFVVNATVTSSSTTTTAAGTTVGGTSSSSSSWGEGNGAYYQVEYTGGDICDTSDVTDSAIVAGTTTGKTTLLQRAASIRYHCGSTFDVQVREDSTCHYIVDVKVPGLCRHPLFRAPISKKQIMKCLPIDNDEEEDV